MKRLIKVLFLLIMPAGVFGQLTPYTSQYVLNPLTINPAYAGTRGLLNFAAFYRKQWVGVKGSPETMSFFVDAPFADDKMGLGINVTNDRIGVTRDTKINASYAYKIGLDNGTLSFGLGAGLVITNTAWSDLIVLDPGDEYLLIDSKSFVVPTFSFGTYYASQKYFAGFSIPKLIGYKFDFEKNKYVLNNKMSDYYYLLNTGYLFDISSNLKFLPSVLLVLSPGDKILYDINAHFKVMERFWLGATYRNNRSVSAMFQFQLNDQIKFGYTYEFDFASLQTYSSGSHEVMLRYEFRYKVEAISPLNF
jgi:type IX secretion system PorP/SprF family membrane protein